MAQSLFTDKKFFRVCAKLDQIESSMTRPTSRKSRRSPSKPFSLTRYLPLLLLWGIPLLGWMMVWFSALSFAPVPWPDDSAFYFVADDLFRWPPQWLMLVQAPFEPSYYHWNFNTMPLYPVLIGLGRFIGIDGSWALKFWPLCAWAASGGLLGWVCFRKGLPLAIATLISLWFTLDPTHRWASVLLRPESLIALCGLSVVLGLTFGYPARWKARGLWDPTSALLVTAAYCHFNAVHLVFPVILFYLLDPRELFRIGALCVLYLVPWLVTVAWHFDIFVHQMTTQWNRLAVPNGWLDKFEEWGRHMYPDMGVIDSWPDSLYSAGWLLWFVVACVIAVLLKELIQIVLTLSERVGERVDQEHSAVAAKAEKKRGVSPAAQPEKTKSEKGAQPAKSSTGGSNAISLLPASGWVLGAAWLYQNKPEQWFIYYLHVSLATFVAIAATKFWTENWVQERIRKQLKIAGVLFTCALLGIWVGATYTQWSDMSPQRTFSWDGYYSLVDCIDAQLTQLEKSRGNPAHFHVFGPTYPDILIELSRRHRHWGFTRTNDFWEAADLAVKHGNDVDAVVVTEIYGHTDREISAPAFQVPQLQSVWMQWKPYYLNRLYTDPNFKPNRYVCQRGRTQAFLYMK